MGVSGVVKALLMGTQVIVKFGEKRTIPVWFCTEEGQIKNYEIVISSKGIHIIKSSDPLLSQEERTNFVDK